MATAIESQSRLKAESLCELASGLSLSLLLKQIVEIVHVRAMVLAVVEVKQMTAHDGLERANLVGQVLELDAVGSGHSTRQVLANHVVDHGVFLCETLVQEILILVDFYYYRFLRGNLDGQLNSIEVAYRTKSLAHIRRRHHIKPTNKIFLNS